MFRKIIFFFFFFYFLVLVQTGFSVHLNIPGVIANFVLLAVVLINIFSSSGQNRMLSALLGGFFLDVFSLGNAGFFGFYTLILACFSVILRVISEKYVRFPVGG
jgi:hypothetical protein